MTIGALPHRDSTSADRRRPLPAVESLPVAHARAEQRLLEQYVIACPVCAKTGAVHLDRAPDGSPVLVRFVCPDSCDVLAADVIAAVLARDISLTA